MEHRNNALLSHYPYLRDTLRNAHYTAEHGQFKGGGWCKCFVVEYEAFLPEVMITPRPNSWWQVSSQVELLRSLLWKTFFFFFSCEISGSVHNHEVQQGKLIVLKLSSIWEIKMKRKKKNIQKTKHFFFSHFLFSEKKPQHSCSIWHYFKIQLLRVLYSIVLTWVSSVVFSKQHSPGRKSPLEGSCGGTLKEVA